jgi:hypothetical protein
MAVVTSAGARIMTGLTSTPAVLADPGEGGGKVRKWVETFETGAADSTTSTYLIARMPSNYRIFGSSVISHDTLGSTTTTLDIGAFNTRSETFFTNDADAINDGIVCSTSGTKDFVKDRANWGKRLWEFINGVTVDPKCEVDIKLTLLDAHLSSGGGTVTVEIDYAAD